MHFHTEYSMDAVSDIRSVLARCRKRGYGVAITDHNNVAGAVKAWNMKKDEFVIPGMEGSTKEGAHSLYYFHDLVDCTHFYDEVVAPLKKKNPFFLPIGIEELMKKGREYGAVVATAHPYASITGFKHIRFKKRIRAVERRFDLTEALNGVVLRGMNKKAVRWARAIGKGMTAGSDGHTTAELGTTLTLAYGYDVDSFLETVKRGYSILLGKEENIFVDVLHQIIKEKIYLKRAHHEGMGMLWIKSHLDEWKIFRRKHKQYGDALHHHYDVQHQELSEENKQFMRRYKYYTQIGKGLFR